MKMTNEQILELKPSEKEQKFHLGRGLYLIVRPTGEKEWRAEYLTASKTRTANILGNFPGTLIEEAWSKNMEIKRTVQVGASTSHIAPCIDLFNGKRTKDKVIRLVKHVKMLEDEILKIKERMLKSDMDYMGSILRAENDWLQEQIDKLKPKKKPIKKKEKVPKKRKKK